MELPECPVCLQVYNNEDAIPRVLACGHSVCESCLTHLIQRFPNTVRCPACNQLVNFPRPSALPKNIDLLRFIDQQQKQQNPKSPQANKKQPTSPPEFLPLSWSEDFYSSWKDWILPEDFISVQSSGNDRISLIQGTVVSSNSSVSLVFVGNSNANDSLFDFSYTVRIVQALNQLKEPQRDELFSILRASSRQFRVCKSCGLWMDSEDGSLFLVCETLNGGFSPKMRELLINHDNEVVYVAGDGLTKENSGMSGFAIVGMDLCEALVGLHSQGLVSGCFSFSCFTLDDFGRVFVNLNEVLVMGRLVRKCVVDDISSGYQNSQAFVSPEVLLKLLHNHGIHTTFNSSDYSVGYSSDVWSLACLLVSLLVGNSFYQDLFQSCYCYLPQIDENKFVELYNGWVKRVKSILDNALRTDFLPLHQILCNCLEFNLKARPCVTKVWKCIRGFLIEPNVDFLSSMDPPDHMDDIVDCIILGNLCFLPYKSAKESAKEKIANFQGSEVAVLHENGEGKVETDMDEGLGIGKFESINLEGHLDCITGLAVGGGFLFSSSFDKVVHMWSLQDLSHVQSFKGHEHRVMAVIFVDANKPLCISADSGGGIFVWSVGLSSDKEPLEKWYEPKDWRYSGIHALAAYGTDQIYTGSGDRSIKAWSLQDYTLTCTMNGHKSVVSCLDVSDGVLYSGSWDGSIRLWSLHDHSPLTVLGEDSLGNVTSILSLCVEHHMLVAAYENGSVKIWRNDVFSRSIETGKGAILALDMAGKWLFTGGWDKKVNVQELSGDTFQLDTRPIRSIDCTSVITALLYCEGKLFAGFADRNIKLTEVVGEIVQFIDVGAGKFLESNTTEIRRIFRSLALACEGSVIHKLKADWKGCFELKKRPTSRSMRLEVVGRDPQQPLHDGTLTHIYHYFVQELWARLQPLKLVQKIYQLGPPSVLLPRPT